MPPPATRLEADSVKQETSGAVTRRTALPPEMQTSSTLFDLQWEKYGGFDLDPCCQESDPTAQKILMNNRYAFVPPGHHTCGNDSPECHVQEDGLAHLWHGTVWMNPPYDRTLKLWVEKAVSEVHCGNARRVVALLPSNTGTPWWQ